MLKAKYYFSQTYQALVIDDITYTSSGSFSNQFLSMMINFEQINFRYKEMFSDSYKINSNFEDFKNLRFTKSEKRLILRSISRLKGV